LKNNEESLSNFVKGEGLMSHEKLKENNLNGYIAIVTNESGVALDIKIDPKSLLDLVMSGTASKIFQPEFFVTLLMTALSEQSNKEGVKK
jgi:hypothetical protein